MKVTLLSHTTSIRADMPPSPEGLIEFAGRLCWNSKIKDQISPDFIKRRIEEGHESIIEHASASFLVEGISRSCSHQLVRHRLISVSQCSQRYIDGSKFDFVVPPDIENNEEATTIYHECLAHIRAAYERLRNKGIKKEDARFLLPNATTTSLVISANLREWRHIIIERGLNPHAQWEIRQLALLFLAELSKIFPAVFADLAEKVNVRTV